MKVKVRLFSESLFGKRGRRIELDVPDNLIKTQDEEVKINVISRQLEKFLSKELKSGGWEIIK